MEQLKPKEENVFLINTVIKSLKKVSFVSVTEVCIQTKCYLLLFKIAGNFARVLFNVKCFLKYCKALLLGR